MDKGSIWKVVGTLGIPWELLQTCKRLEVPFHECAVSLATSDPLSPDFETTSGPEKSSYSKAKHTLLTTLTQRMS